MARPDLKATHDVAAKLGRTVRELLSSMDSAELTYWFAWLKLGSREEQIADLHAATGEALLYNANRSSKAAAAKVDQFLLYHKPPPEPLTAEKIKMVFAGVNAIAEARGKAGHG